MKPITFFTALAGLGIVIVAADTVDTVVDHALALSLIGLGVWAAVVVARHVGPRLRDALRPPGGGGVVAATPVGPRPGPYATRWPVFDPQNGSAPVPGTVRTEPCMYCSGTGALPKAELDVVDRLKP